MRVTLKIVTSIFSGRRSTGGEPELRVPTLRGAFRFWLRALLGGVLGYRTAAWG